MVRKSKIQHHGSDNNPDMRNNAFPSGPPAEEYKVGPGRPPKAHQFKPGQSGNPKGAKRKAPSLLPNLKEQFERAFNQTAKVTQGLTTPGHPGARADAPEYLAFHHMHGVGTQNRNSRLNGWPTRTPVNASPRPSHA